MNTREEMKHAGRLLLPVLLLAASGPALAQRPQDNWYLESTWIKDMAVSEGGLSAPYGVAIGHDQRIYVGDQGAGCVNAYLPDGTFSFAITNDFGSGQSFSQPRGMIMDRAGNLYVADMGHNCVFVFTADGTFLRKIGGVAGSANGQLGGVIDVAVASAGHVYVLESTNARVSVFNPDSTFAKIFVGSGLLDGQLQSPSSIAIAPDGSVYIAQNNLVYKPEYWQPFTSLCFIKAFDTNGILRFKLDQSFTRNFYNTIPEPEPTRFGPCSVRVDPTGLLHVIVSWRVIVRVAPQNELRDINWALSDSSLSWNVFHGDGTPLTTYTAGFGGQGDKLASPCNALGDDGKMVLCGNATNRVQLFHYAMREQWAPPRNCLPMPAVLEVKQRPNSPLVDVDYQVTDADDANVHTAMLVFKNAFQALSNCISSLTLVEGTATNLGPGIASGQTQRVTWNAGADWSVNLGDFHVTVLARDSRPGLLDIHYLNLPPDRGMPALKISRSPLVESDFMQVWWWLLATNDSAINLSSNRIYGVNGRYAAKVLCENTTTTADGRAYVYEKMGAREATAEEVDWARHGSTATTINQWAPVRTVGGRPGTVNEYGFDTGTWDSETCKWVVPLN